MHHKAVSKIANALREVAASATPPTAGDRLPMRFHHGVGYCLPHESASLYSEQIRTILGHADYSKKFTEAHLSKKLDAIFAELLKDDSLDLEAQLQTLLQECDGFRGQATVYLALEGVQTNLCLRLGSIRIVPGGPELIGQLDEQAASVITTSKSDEPTKEYIATFLRKDFEGEFARDCAVIYSVNAEHGRALERAREEARFAVDLLRLMSKFSLPLQQDIRIGLRGERPHTNRSGFVFSDSGFNTSHDSVGSVFRLNLDAETIGKAEKAGLLKLSDRYLQGNLTGIDKILVRSIHWLSVALTQDEPESAVITLIVALECMFKSSAGSSITSTVCESTAFLLSSSKDGRLRVSAKIREFYGKRSALAHGGKKAVTDAERTLLLQYVAATILAVLNLEHIDSQDKLMHWVEEQKFGGAEGGL